MYSSYFLNTIFMNTKTILSIAFLCLFAPFSLAQLTANFEKGSIVQTNGQKLEGYIKTEALEALSKSICFKTEVDKDNCSLFDTETIQSFQTENGKIFELITTKINKNTTEIKTFGNLIVSGKASLYKTVFDDEEMYIIKNEGVFYVLQNLKLVDGEVELRDYNYRGYLNIATEGFTNNRTYIEFSESNFIKVINDYNASKGVESKQTAYLEKSIGYYIGFVGGGFVSNENEIFGQFYYRKFFPKISQNTSLNIGLSYYFYRYLDPIIVKYIPQIEMIDSYTNFQLVSVPLEVRQDLLNNKIRPNVFAGFNFSYASKTNNLSIYKNNDGFQNNFGIGLIYGVGIEADITKQIMIKAEYRKEIFDHLLLFGIGYNFSN